MLIDKNHFLKSREFSLKTGEKFKNPSKVLKKIWYSSKYLIWTLASIPLPIFILDHGRNTRYWCVLNSPLWTTFLKYVLNDSIILSEIDKKYRGFLIRALATLLLFEENIFYYKCLMLKMRVSPGSLKQIYLA